MAKKTLVIVKAILLNLILVGIIMLILSGIVTIIDSWQTPHKVIELCTSQCNRSVATDSAENLFAYECCYEACVKSTETLLDEDCPLK